MRTRRQRDATQARINAALALPDDPASWPPPPEPPSLIPLVAPIDAAKALRLVCLEEACKLAQAGESDAKTLTRAGRFARFADRGLD